MTNTRRTLTVLAGNGAGALAPLLTLRTGRAFVDIIAADLDSDGDVNLALADPPASSIVCLFNLLVS